MPGRSLMFSHVSPPSRERHSPLSGPPLSFDQNVRRACQMVAKMMRDSVAARFGKPIDPAALQTVDATAKELLIPGAVVLLRTPHGEFTVS